MTMSSSKIGRFCSPFLAFNQLQRLMITDIIKENLAEQRHGKHIQLVLRMPPPLSQDPSIMIGPPAPPETKEETRIASISYLKRSNAGSKLFQACREYETHKFWHSVLQTCYEGIVWKESPSITLCYWSTGGVNWDIRCLPCFEMNSHDDICTSFSFAKGRQERKCGFRDHRKRNKSTGRIACLICKASASYRKLTYRDSLGSIFNTPIFERLRPCPIAFSSITLSPAHYPLRRACQVRLTSTSCNRGQRWEIHDWMGEWRIHKLCETSLCPASVTGWVTFPDCPPNEHLLRISFIRLAIPEEIGNERSEW